MKNLLVAFVLFGLVGLPSMAEDAAPKHDDNKVAQSTEKRDADTTEKKTEAKAKKAAFIPGPCAVDRKD